MSRFSEYAHHSLTDCFQKLLKKCGDFIVQSTEPTRGHPRDYILSVRYDDNLDVSIGSR